MNPNPPTDTRLVCITLLSLLLISLFVYWEGLDGPLLLDDFPQLSPLMDRESLETGGWWGFLFSESGPLMRPVSMATFLLNAAMSGDDIFAWKLTNLVIHLLNGSAVFFLSTHLFSYDRETISTRSWWLATILAGIWLLHSLHVSTVLYTVQRMTQLSALFVFTGLLCYVAGRKRQLGGKPGHMQIGLCFLLFLPLAALSKENGVLLVVLALFVEILLFRIRGDRAVRRGIYLYFLIFLVVPMVSGLCYIAFYSGFSFDYDGRDFSLKERVITQLRVIWLYIYQLVIPIQRNMGFFHDDFVVSRGWMAPPTTLASAFGITFLLFVAWQVRNRLPLVALGIVFFFMGHSLESTFLPLELVYEHRNYLPSYGVFLALVGTLSQTNVTRTLKIILTVIFLASLAGLTFLRTQTWASEERLYSFMYRAHPQSPRVTATVAEYLTRQGRYEDALQVLVPVRDTGPLLQSLYIQCRRDGRLHNKEVVQVTKLLSSPIKDQTATGLIELARLGLEGECLFSKEQYVSLLEKASNLTTSTTHSNQKILLYKAQYHWDLGQSEAAIATLDEAFNVRTDNPIPLFLGTEWLLEMGDYERAAVYFSKAKAAASKSRYSYEKFIQDIGEILEERTAS